MCRTNVWHVCTRTNKTGRDKKLCCFHFTFARLRSEALWRTEQQRPHVEKDQMLDTNVGNHRVKL